MTLRVLVGDCRVLMAAEPAESVDAIVTDPPYGLGFMGKEWDRIGDTGRGARVRSERAGELTPIGHGHISSTGPYLAAGVDSLRSAGRPFQDWSTAWAIQALRILKPGGYLLAFGGTRTFHRLTCALEDAGFEIRDVLSWLYGSGFPKSLDVSKAIDKAAGAEREVLGVQIDRWTGKGVALNFATDRPQAEIPVTGDPATDDARARQGWGTALKPAWEPIILARKPLAETSVAANVLRHGTGALNVDGCRIESAERPLRERHPLRDDVEYHPSSLEGRVDGSLQSSKAVGTTALGRWPANVALDEEAARALDEQSGKLTRGANPTRRGTDKFRGIYAAFPGQEECEPARGVDVGGASRFFFVSHGEGTIETWNEGRANVAELSSSRSNEHGGSAPNFAQTAAEHTADATRSRSTNGSLSESKWTAAHGTQLTLSTERRSEPESSQPSMADLGNLADDAAIPNPIDTTTTTTSRCSSCGCAGHATFNATSKSVEVGVADSANSSRLFYTAKASGSERAPDQRHAPGEVNRHPTVKPVDLMRWLVRLVTPPGGTVCDPFMGSGSTGIAASREGFGFLGMEQDPDYAETARLRIVGDAPMFVQVDP